MMIHSTVYGVENISAKGDLSANGAVFMLLRGNMQYARDVDALFLAG